jgi:hypothetical protein
MAQVIVGNHSSVIVPKQDRESICKFYCDVLGGRITKADPERDFILLGENYLVFLYGDVEDASEFGRTARTMWLEFKSDNVAEMSQKILASGLCRKLDIPDPHLYFQAPGGQCWRLVGIDEDLSFYEGTGEGTDVTKIKESRLRDRSYTATIEVAKSPHDVFTCITEPSKWWSKEVKGSSAKLNDAFILDIPKTHYSKQQLIEVVPDKKIVWLVTESKLEWLKKNKSEWTGTKMIFLMTAQGNKTVLQFTHEGLVPEEECYVNCEKGWNMIIKDWLFNFVTKNQTV